MMVAIYGTTDRHSNEFYAGRENESLNARARGIYTAYGFCDFWFGLVWLVSVISGAVSYPYHILSPVTFCLWGSLICRVETYEVMKLT